MMAFSFQQLLLMVKIVMGVVFYSAWWPTEEWTVDAKVEIEEFSFGMYYIYKATKNTCSHVSIEQN